MRILIRAAQSVRLAALPARVAVVEVSARDGLQNETTIVPTPVKVAYLNQLTEAGFPVVEVTSFVSPKRVPQLADASEVLQSITKREGVHYPVLTPNRKGLENAIAAGAREIAVFTAASEEFCQRNLNMKIKSSIDQFISMAETARHSGIRVRGYVSCAAGCPFSGDVDPSLVASIAHDLIELGCYEVSIGDTIGVGTSASITRVFEACLKRIDVHRLAAHMHDTYGQGLANVLTALQLGIASIDTSVAGLGGCPFAKGATGNVATEDVLYLLDGLGIEHGVDWDTVLKANKYICQVLHRTNASRAATALHAHMSS